MREKIIFIIFFFLFSFSLCYSLPLKNNWTWSHRFGISGAEDAYLRPSSIQQTKDGGYIIAGDTNWGPLQCLIIKINASGIIEWQKVLGDPKDDDYLMRILQTSDGGYIAVGGTDNLGAYPYDSWIVKLNAFGDIIWQRAYGGTDYDGFYGIQQTADGGYIVSGETYSFGVNIADAWLVKLDSSGNIIWQKTYGGISYDGFYNIQQTIDGGYIAVGWTSSFASNQDMWILKIDALGNIIWQKAFGIATGSAYAYAIVQDSDGNYVVAGNSPLFEILKLDSSGNIIWQKQYSASENEKAINIRETIDKGYVILGDNSFEILIIKIDSSGNIIWQKKYNSGEIQWGISMEPTSDEGVIVAGSWPSDNYCIDIWVFKANGLGELDLSCSFFVSDADLIASDTSITPIDTIAEAKPSSAVVKDTVSASINYTAQDSLICEESNVPVLVSHKPEIDDSNSSTHNGIIEENEAVNLIGNLENISNIAANSITGLMRSSIPIIITNPHATYPDIIGGADKSAIIPYSLVAPGAFRPSDHWDFTIYEQPFCEGCLHFTYNFKFHIGNSFLDVAPQNMFYRYIEEMLHSGVTSGCKPRYYCPLNNVSREQMAKFVCDAVHNAYGMCPIASCQHLFNDVPDTNLFCSYIEKLYTDNVIDGCQAQPLRYCPSNPVKREEMAKFICRGMNRGAPWKCNLAYCSGIFADVPASNPFCDFIEDLYQQGIISGCQSSPLLYCPNNNVTREQMAKFIANAFGFQF